MILQILLAYYSSNTTKLIISFSAISNNGKFMHAQSLLSIVCLVACCYYYNYLCSLLFFTQIILSINYLYYSKSTDAYFALIQIAMVTSNLSLDYMKFVLK